jgi:hypothetical protein
MKLVVVIHFVPGNKNACPTNSTVARDGKPNMTHHPELLAALVEDSLETQVQEQQASTAQNRNTIYHLSAK